MSQYDRPALGIFLMLGFCIAAPLGDSIAKFLGQTWPLLPLLFSRFLIQFLVLTPIAVIKRLPLRMTARGWRLTITRTILHMAGIGLMFESLRHLPLADAVAIAFVMPFIMLLLGKFVLGEEVGKQRILACAVGFIGTLMVVQPSFLEVGAYALLPLGVAVVFALFMLVTRQVAHETDPISLQVISGGLASLIMLPVFLLTDITFIPGLAVPFDWWLILFNGLLGTSAHLLMTWALRFAPSATLAPMQYLEIPFATLVGWLIFRDFPDGLALAGIAVTIAAGLYVIWREQQKAAQLKARQSAPL